MLKKDGNALVREAVGIFQTVKDKLLSAIEKCNQQKQLKQDEKARIDFQISELETSIKQANKVLGKVEEIIG